MLLEYAVPPEMEKFPCSSGADDGLANLSSASLDVDSCSSDVPPSVRTRSSALREIFGSYSICLAVIVPPTVVRVVSMSVISSSSTVTVLSAFMSAGES